jgi:hypothetical protein
VECFSSCFARGQKLTYDIELVLLFFILNVLIHLLETAGKGTPSFGVGTMPDEYVAMVGGGGN